jgi:hypothetical protein
MLVSPKHCLIREQSVSWQLLSGYTQLLHRGVGEETAPAYSCKQDRPYCCKCWACRNVVYAKL